MTRLDIFLDCRFTTRRVPNEPFMEMPSSPFGFRPTMGGIHMPTSISLHKWTLFTEGYKYNTVHSIVIWVANTASCRRFCRRREASPPEAEVGGLRGELATLGPSHKVAQIQVP